VQWHEQGEKRHANKAVNPRCVNVYMGITKYGATEPVIVTGTSKQQSTFITKAGKPAKNITSAEYDVVLREHLLPDGAHLMLESNHRTWVFQQDNDPVHSCASTVIHTYNRAHNTHIKLLPNWPAYSPDLNLIENWWSVVDAKMNELGCKTFEEYTNRLCSTLKAVPSDWLHMAYAGMQQRLQDTIMLKGDKTAHRLLTCGLSDRSGCCKSISAPTFVASCRGTRLGSGARHVLCTSPNAAHWVQLGAIEAQLGRKEAGRTGWSHLPA
jgi:hypothetical protein